MIQVNNVTKTFDHFKALDDLSMHAEKGSIYGLVGPNGAGKSTIIRNLTGVYRPDDGEILVDGQPVYENTAVKQKIAYIPDNFFFYHNDSLTDMMHLYRGIYPSFQNERFERLAEAFPTIDRKQPLRRLSKGMQKQAAFWLAISCMPEVLILDEPVDGLDPIIRRQVWSLLMSDVTEHGTTVLISSHNLRELEDVCDCVGILDKGHMRLECALSDMQENICKLQVVFEGDLPVFPKEAQVLHISNTGRVYTIIMRASNWKAKKLLSACNPLLLDILPLTLEEIFIYELGGSDYELKNILF